MVFPFYSHMFSVKEAIKEPSCSSTFKVQFKPCNLQTSYLKNLESQTYSMVFGRSRCVIAHDDLEESGSTDVNQGALKIQMPEASSKKSSDGFVEKTEEFFKAKLLCRVFPEDYKKVKKSMIFDPNGETIRQWSKILLVACLVSVFVDPLFFYLPKVRKEVCIDDGSASTTQTVLTIIRSLADAFYVIQIFVRFRTAYVVPSSRVLGRGEFVIDPSKIAFSYLQRGFWLDLIAALPLPQVLIGWVIPKLRISANKITNNILQSIILLQYVPRVFLIFPLKSKIVEASGIVTEKAWAGAAYNLLLFMLASHVSGACWYLLSVERQDACWKSACNLEKPHCEQEFFDCRWLQDPRRINWFKYSNVTNLCDPNNNFYQFGIYANAVSNNVIGSPFFNKYFYTYWWGLNNLSSMGQNLSTSTYIGEVLFTIFVSTLGLVLFALLIGNMQRYLQSTTIRLEEWRIKTTDTEQWMHHRQLPPELRHYVRKFNQYKWVATRGVDEEAILHNLPSDLRREIKRHLCLNLVRRVPLFDQMDETMLDVICERLKPVLGTEGMYLLREGDPVNQMLFIIRGHLDSYTTNGGLAGFFDSCRIGPGDFCGEELLTWALDPRPQVILPSSTRTVKAITEVEAFALMAEDLKFVASQFRRLHSKQLRHKFRFHSHQWRTWAACFIQVAWRRYKKLKAEGKIISKEPGQPLIGSFWDEYAESLIANARSASFRQAGSKTTDVVNSLQKPEEPDFEE